MASRKENTRGQIDIALDVSPDSVDAGAAMTVHARASCAPSCDLSGHTLSVKDERGADQGALDLTETDDEEHATGSLTLKVPVKTGDYAWSVLSPAFVKDGVSFEELSKPIAFKVMPHTTRVLAWDIPPTVVAGDAFKIAVGVKCSSECSFADTSFEVYDHDGAKIATGVLAKDLWPGTTGLYFTTLELKAPSEAGLYHWTVKSTGNDLDKPHAEGAADFSVRVVGVPDCVVTVEAVDKVSQEPVAGAWVGLHPYKAMTDERGLAKLNVTKGEYTLFVAKSAYFTLGLPIDVKSDMTAKAELDLEPVYERN